MKHFCVPFCDDETATMYFSAVDLMEGDLSQENITREQVQHIFESCEVEMGDLSLDVAIAAIMHFCVLADGVHCEDFTYMFTHLAIIPIKHVDTLTTLNDALWEQCGDDSSTYRACETFNKMCSSLADKVVKLKTNALIEEI